MTDGGPGGRRRENLAARLDAVERALTDDDAAVTVPPDAVGREGRVDDLEATVSDLEERVAELEATLQSVRGYLGGVDAVNERVERRADAALAAVERLEASDAAGSAPASEDALVTSRLADQGGGDGDHGTGDRGDDVAGRGHDADHSGRRDAARGGDSASGAPSGEHVDGKTDADVSGEDARTLAARVREVLR